MNEKFILRNTLSDNAFWIVNKAITRVVGIEAAVLLADLISKEQYFEEHNMLSDDGSFFNTQENILNDTTLSTHKQRHSTNVLKKYGLVSVVKRGQPPKNHFKLHHKNIIEYLIVQKLNNQSFNNSTINRSKTESTINKNKEIKIKEEDIGNSNELHEDSFNNKSLREGLKKKMNKNKSLKKSKKKPSLNNDEKECIKFFDYWVNKDLTPNHKKDTKMYKKCLMYFSEFKNGIFGQNKDFNKKSLSDNNINLKALNKKWTDEDIYKAFDNLYLRFLEGYWPYEDKKIIYDLGLEKILFNISNGKSWFLNAYFNPPKKIKFEQKKKTTSNEKLYNIIRDFFDNLSIAQENDLITHTNNLFEHLNKLYSVVDPYVGHTNFSTYMGSQKNPEPLIKNLVSYHKKVNSEKVIGKFSPTSKTWKNFLDEMARIHRCYLEPDEKRLNLMKIDYERFQRRKK